MYKILVLNLGGTSTKLAVFEDEIHITDHTLRHTADDMERAPLARDQLEYRKELILQWMKENGYTMDDFSALAIRGATIFEATQSGTYLVDGRYKEALLELYLPDEPLVHGNRIVTPLALDLIGGRNIPIYITDPSSVNEMSDLAKVSGIAGYERTSRFHALNQKAIARKHAKQIGRPYDECRFVVAHMGAGISVAAHELGRIVDVNDAGEGYGPFTPERSGTVATGIMMNLCFDFGYTKAEVHRMVRGESGVASHLGTSDMRKVEKMMESGDTKAQLIFLALAYQVAKEIGSCVAALKGKADAILLTGGIAYSEKMVQAIKEYVIPFADVFVYAGEVENEALASGACRVLSGQEQAILL